MGEIQCFLLNLVLQLLIMWNFHKPEVALSVFPNSLKWICPPLILTCLRHPVLLIPQHLRQVKIVFCVTENIYISNLSRLITNKQRWKETKGTQK